jgi:hypothetical protein
MAGLCERHALAAGAPDDAPDGELVGGVVPAIARHFLGRPGSTARGAPRAMGLTLRG